MTNGDAWSHSNSLLCMDSHSVETYIMDFSFKGVFKRIKSSKCTIHSKVTPCMIFKHKAMGMQVGFAPT